jgi:ribonuclease HII
MICGVDEAGRGPVIGPLVIAGVLAGGEELESLTAMGVKDSKMLSTEEREGLYKRITGRFQCQSVKIPARELDSLMARKSLNKVEAELFANVINDLGAKTVFIDAADVNCRKFQLMVQGHLSSSPNLVVEHKADERYPIVSAASIVAKVERDREIKELHKHFGDFGSGYSSDPRTQRFLARFFTEHRSFPDCVRKKWKTTARASNLKLEEFY